MAVHPYERKDFYYKKAKSLGLNSRAAFKIMELHSKFRLFKPGMYVVDLGASPGGWLQIISKEVGPSGQVIGVDLEPAVGTPAKNVLFIQGDIREERTQNRILLELGRKVDVVVSDLAPHLSGVKFQDQYNSYELAEMGLKCCKLVLKEGGDFVVKIFPGEELEQFKGTLKACFVQVKVYIPDSSRKSSSEIYLVSKGFSSRHNGQS